MNEVCILIIMKEAEYKRPEVSVSAYRSMDDALRAYNVAVDEARAEAEDYEFAHEDIEISTDTYRYFRIEDLHRNDVITIEIETMDIIGEEPDDICCAL